MCCVGDHALATGFGVVTEGEMDPDPHRKGMEADKD